MDCCYHLGYSLACTCHLMCQCLYVHVWAHNTISALTIINDCSKGHMQSCDSYGFLKNERLENLDKIYYRKLLNVILISSRKEEGVLADLPIVMLKPE